MSALTLLDPRAACPVDAGDVVHVPEPVPMPCGRVVRKGRYAVLRVEPTPAEHAGLGPYRLVVEARLDCSRLPRRFHPPSTEERTAGAEVPLAAQPTRVCLYPGQFTAFAGDGVGTLPDHPLQTD